MSVQFRQPSTMVSLRASWALVDAGTLAPTAIPICSVLALQRIVHRRPDGERRGIGVTTLSCA
jgi:hypothetical protein